MWDQLARNRAAKSRFPFNLTYPILRQTSLWHLMLRARGVQFARRGDVARQPMAEVTNDGPSRDPELRSFYKETFSALADELERSGVPFISTAYPAHLTVYGAWSTEQLDWIRGVSEANRVHQVPILQVMRESGLQETELYLLPWDGHPSALGYSLAAQALAGAIRSLRVLESCQADAQTMDTHPPPP